MMKTSTPSATVGVSGDLLVDDLQTPIVTQPGPSVISDKHFCLNGDTCKSGGHHQSLGGSVTGTANPISGGAKGHSRRCHKSPVNHSISSFRPQQVHFSAGKGTGHQNVGGSATGAATPQDGDNMRQAGRGVHSSLTAQPGRVHRRPTDATSKGNVVGRNTDGVAQDQPVGMTSLIQAHDPEEAGVFENCPSARRGVKRSNGDCL